MIEDNMPTANDKSMPRYQPPGSGPTSAANSTSYEPPAWPPAAPPLTSQEYPVWGSSPTPNFTGGQPAAWVTPPYAENRPAALYAGPEAEAYRRAVKRVNARLAFRKHLTIYLMVNAVLWTIAIIGLLNGGSLGRTLWPMWTTLFWGIGVMVQYYQVYGQDEERRKRMVEEELRRMGLPGPHQ